MAGIGAEQIAHLQKIQNSAAKVVLRKSKRDLTTPLLRELHWLPVKFRIDFKIACFAYHYFDGTLPQYLSSLLDVYKPNRMLRSSIDERVLSCPKVSLKKYGERSFAYQAPHVWNSLPHHIRHSESAASFKSQLKTHMFKLAFDC